MSKLYNLAKMTTSTVGTGTITLGSAVSGFLTFDLAGVQDGDVITYGIYDGVNSEVGRGTYSSSGTTLARTTVIKSTNNDNAIDLTGDALVFITAIAEDFISRYIHDQGVPSSSWIINHNLNSYPTVTVLDSSGKKVFGDVNYPSVNSMTINFSAPFGGKAYLL